MGQKFVALRVLKQVLLCNKTTVQSSSMDTVHWPRVSLTQYLCTKHINSGLLRGNVIMDSHENESFNHHGWCGHTQVDYFSSTYNILSIQKLPSLNITLLSNHIHELTLFLRRTAIQHLVEEVKCALFNSLANCTWLLQQIYYIVKEQLTPTLPNTTQQLQLMAMWRIQVSIDAPKMWALLSKLILMNLPCTNIRINNTSAHCAH